MSLLVLPMALSAQKAEKVHSITRMEKQGSYYTIQAKLWQKETQENWSNADAWFNYFTAARYANRFTRDSSKPYELTRIVEDMKPAIPNTFEYYYLQFAVDSWSKEAFPYLEKAYDTDPGRHETFSAFITHYELERNRSKVKEFCQKWYQSADHSPGLMAWNYNLLAGLEPNAILFTHGDNDTYPAWILQYVKNFRTDVRVFNTSLLTVDSYRNLVFKELGIPAFEKTMAEAGGWEAFQMVIFRHFMAHSKDPLYFAISISKSIRDQLENELYLTTGLAFKYSTEDLDNLTALQAYYEQEMLTDQFKISLQADPAADVLRTANLNYLPALLKLLKHYREQEDTSRVLNLKKQIRQIATLGGRLEEVKKYLED